MRDSRNYGLKDPMMWPLGPLYKMWDDGRWDLRMDWPYSHEGLGST